MKKNKPIYFILMFLPIITTIIALFFLPPKIPANYDATGAVTRFGSKYETLILPLITVPFGFFMLAMAKFSSRSESNNNSNNENVIVIGGIVSLIVFNVMNCYFLYTDFKQVTNLSDMDIDLNSLLFACLGIGFIIIGNIMPKAKLNSIVGLRTKWSMKNETTWKRSQRFGGITFIASGLLIALGCILFFRGMNAFWWSFAIMTIMLIADLTYSYQVSKDTK